MYCIVLRHVGLLSHCIGLCHAPFILFFGGGTCKIPFMGYVARRAASYSLYIHSAESLLADTECRLRAIGPPSAVKPLDSPTPTTVRCAEFDAD